MIVVASGSASPAAIEIARRVAASGARPEFLGPVSPGPPGDRFMLGLTAAGIGHAATLRSPASDLDAADLELALRYLPDVRVIVVLGTSALRQAAAEAATWSGAALVVVTTGESAHGADVAAGERPDLRAVASAVVLEAPARDPDGAFAGLVAALALRLDAGASMAEAWPATLGALGAEPVNGGRGQVRGAAAGPAGTADPGSAPPGSGRRSGRR